MKFQTILLSILGLALAQSTTDSSSDTLATTTSMNSETTSSPAPTQILPTDKSGKHKKGQKPGYGFDGHAPYICLPLNKKDIYWAVSFLPKDIQSQVSSIISLLPTPTDSSSDQASPTDDSGVPTPTADTATNSGDDSDTATDSTNDSDTATDSTNTSSTTQANSATDSATASNDGSNATTDSNSNAATASATTTST